MSRQIEYVEIPEDDARKLIRELDLVGVVHMGGDVILYYKRADEEKVERREIATYGDIDVYLAMWPEWPGIAPVKWSKNLPMIP